MSVSQGLPNYLSSVANIGTRVKGPSIAGQIQDNTPSGPMVGAGGFICVQSTSSVTAQVVSTLDAVLASRASFVYIPVTTGNLIGAGAPPYLGCGTPLVWNDTDKNILVWSSGAASWMRIASSAAGTGAFSTVTT